ncbi:MAG TPA: transglycosylase family protein [Acidimicrobiia bacterium]|nr:transglycosylase family protein [Acidimicrobiia bacterium]
MRTRIAAAIGPAVLVLGLAVAVTQVARGAESTSGERSDSGRPAAAPESSRVSGDARAVHQGAAAAAYADAVAQAEIQRYWQAMDDARKAEAARQSRSSGPRRSSCADPLACIKECESHGNYGSVSSSGTYRGAYQFSQTTWESVGGTGDPAAASPAEQDARAATLYAQSGSSPWPTCG